MQLLYKGATPHPLRGSSPRRGAFKRSLQLDLKVWFDFLGDLDGFLQDGIELVVVGFQHHFLGHKADAGVGDAGQLLNGGLDLSGAVGTVDFDSKLLFLGGGLLFNKI